MAEDLASTPTRWRGVIGIFLDRASRCLGVDGVRGCADLLTSTGTALSCTFCLFGDSGSRLSGAPCFAGVVLVETSLFEAPSFSGALSSTSMSSPWCLVFRVLRETNGFSSSLSAAMTKSARRFARVVREVFAATARDFAARREFGES
jgi:hypothetical protein